MTESLPSILNAFIYANQQVEEIDDWYNHDNRNPNPVLEHIPQVLPMLILI
jgi:hypothetical protein